MSVASAAAPINIGGTAYRDLDEDGIKDAGETGIANLKVRNGNGSIVAATDANGNYLLTGLAPSGKIIIETGWFRSQCDQTTCAAGPGPDNDFSVDNQFIRYDLTGKPSASDINVGLRVPTNVTDVAARLSWAPTTACVAKVGDTDYNICQPGEAFQTSGQIFNQGTGSLTGIKAKLFVPYGDCLEGVPAIYSEGTSTGITMNVSPAAPTCATRDVNLDFSGTLPPGGAIRVNINGKVDSVAPGPGTPGCVIDDDGNPQPTSTCSIKEPQSRAWVLRVSEISESGDPDSFHLNCPADFSPRYCATGVHDKRVTPDEIDPVGHNVVWTDEDPTDFDLKGYQTITKATPVGGYHAGDLVTFRTFARNDATGRTDLNQANPNWQIKTFFPKGTPIGTLPWNSLAHCSRSTSSPSADTVTCDMLGPLAPYVSSFTIDIPVTLPATLGTFKTVSCVSPNGAQSAEITPAGATCDLNTVPGDTPTNNDAEKTIVIKP